MLFCRVEVWLLRLMLLLLLLVVLLLRGSLIMVSAAAAAAAMSVHFDAFDSEGREEVRGVRRHESLFLAAPPLLQQRPSLALRAGLAAAVAIARCHLLHFHRR